MKFIMYVKVRGKRGKKIVKKIILKRDKIMCLHWICPVSVGS